jgi:O-antigen ligase
MIRIPSMKNHSTTPVRWAYLLQETVLILVFSYFLFAAFSTLGLIRPLTLQITAVLLTLVVVGYLFTRPAIPAGWVLPVFAAFIVMLISSVFALDPPRSLYETWITAVSFFTFFFLFTMIRRGLPAELIIKALLVVGVMFMIWGWIPAIAWYRQWLAAEPGRWLPSLTFRLDIPNVMAVMMYMMSLLAISRLLYTPDRFPASSWRVYSLSGLALLYLSSSRGGWVGTAAGLFSIGLLSFYYQKERWLAAWTWFRARRRLQFLIIPGALVAMTALGYLLFKQATHSTHPAFFSARWYLWEPAWLAFLDHPLTGIGLYNYPSYYFQVHSTPPNVYFLHAHSMYFEILMSSGILGFAAFVWLMVVLLARLVESSQERRALRARPGECRRLRPGRPAGARHLRQRPPPVPVGMFILMAALAAALSGGTAQPAQPLNP